MHYKFIYKCYIFLVYDDNYSTVIYMEGISFDFTVLKHKIIILKLNFFYIFIFMF